MTLQQLIHAVEAYKSGSISKAAQNLLMAQPNLSTSIRELESELGTQIFKRTPKGIECTESGKAFLSYATDIVTRFEYLQSRYRKEGQREKTLSLITARSSEVCVTTAEYINQLDQEGIAFRIKIKESTNYNVITDVAASEADIGILRTNTLDASYYFQMAEYQGLRIIETTKSPYVVLFSQDHPLAQKNHITQSMLQSYIEVVHGDYEMPMYPFSNYQYHNVQPKDIGKKVVFTYDRASLMDILTNVTGSYVWTTTTHAKLKEIYHLTERSCDAPPVEGIEAIVINRRHPMTPEMKYFVNLILQKSGLPPLKDSDAP